MYYDTSLLGVFVNLRQKKKNYKYFLKTCPLFHTHKKFVKHLHNLFNMFIYTQVYLLLYINRSDLYNVV